MESKPLLCLSMIVKNEAKSIVQVLESCQGVIDCAVIVDTGSTDETKALARETLDRLRIPGDIYDRPFVDFATTRNVALELSKKKARFSLVLSGDEFLVDGGMIREALRLTEGRFDIYCIKTVLRHQQTENMLVRVFWSGCDARYRGVIHETAIGYDEHRAGQLPGFIDYDDTWALDESLVKARYARDCAMLQAAINRGEFVPKMVAYLLGYLVSGGEYQRAIDLANTHQKAIVDGEPEYHRGINVSLMKAHLGLADGDAKHEREAYARLQEICKHPRIAKEALYEYALWLWKRKRFPEALELANICVTVPVYPLSQIGSRDIGVTTWKPHWLVASCAQALGMNDICEKAAANAAFASGYAKNVMDQLALIVDIQRPN